MLLSRGLDRGIQKRLTWWSAQDPIQGLGVRRKQGNGLQSLMTEYPVQILQGQQQVQTTLPALLQVPPLIDLLVNCPALLQDLPAWVSHSPFNSFPLMQKDPDFRVSPWATRRTCKGWREVMSAFDTMPRHMSALLGTHPAH